MGMGVFTVDPGRVDGEGGAARGRWWVDRSLAPAATWRLAATWRWRGRSGEMGDCERDAVEGHARGKGGGGVVGDHTPAAGEVLQF